MKREEQGESEEKPTKVSFSLPQIVGGALAASTAAAIGSQLGVAGTIFGAAVASVIGGVAGTLYSAGIEGTHRKVSKVIQRGSGGDTSSDNAGSTQTTRVATDQGAPTAVSAPTAGQGSTRELPGVDQTLFRPEPARVSSASQRGASVKGRRGSVWKVALGSGVAIFVVALAGITALELGLGHALGGKGDTTLTQVVPALPGGERPAPSATATATPSSVPTSSASHPSASPTAAPTSTGQEGEEQSTSPEPSASAKPTTPRPTETIGSEAG